jgi:hypothetical protein
MKSLAFNSLPAHPHEGNATTTRRIAWQVRGVYPLQVKPTVCLDVMSLVASSWGYNNQRY